jgi:putative endonuclease
MRAMTPAVLLRRLVAFLAGLPERPRGSRGVGYDWERLAERTLRGEGYRILDRNYRGRAGEIDFVADDHGTLCFVEVKGRSGPLFGQPGEAVTAEKQRRIFRAAEEYLLRRRMTEALCRFDVVSIRASGKGTEVEIVRDAFRGPTAPRRRR